MKKEFYLATTTEGMNVSSNLHHITDITHMQKGAGITCHLCKILALHTLMPPKQKIKLNKHVKQHHEAISSKIRLWETIKQFHFFNK